jgi:hypothetical protein
LNLSTTSFELTSTSGKLDSVFIQQIEIPVYFRLRFGKANRAVQFWLAGGAALAFPTGNSSVITYDSYGNLIQETSSGKIGNTLLFLSSITGLEIMFGSKNDEYSRDNYRMIFFVKVDYLPESLLNSRYNYNHNSVISSYSRPEFYGYRVTYGFNFLMKTKVFVDLWKKAFKESLKSYRGNNF